MNEIGLKVHHAVAFQKRCETLKQRKISSRNDKETVMRSVWAHAES